MSNSLFQLNSKCEKCGKEFIVTYSSVICPDCQKSGKKRDSFKESYSPAVRHVDMDYLLEHLRSPEEDAAMAAWNHELFLKNFNEKYVHEGWKLSEDEKSMYKYVGDDKNVKSKAK